MKMQSYKKSFMFILCAGFIVTTLSGQQAVPLSPKNPPLPPVPPVVVPVAPNDTVPVPKKPSIEKLDQQLEKLKEAEVQLEKALKEIDWNRSEERRVGKECIS